MFGDKKYFNVLVYNLVIFKDNLEILNLCNSLLEYLTFLSYKRHSIYDSNVARRLPRNPNWSGKVCQDAWKSCQDARKGCKEGCQLAASPIGWGKAAKMPGKSAKMPGKAAKMPGKTAKKASLPRIPYWSGKSCQDARQGCQEAPIGRGKAAKKPLLVGEKLPRCLEKLPRRLPRCLEKLPRSPSWSGKRCQEAWKSCQEARKCYQEAPFGQGKAAKNPLLVEEKLLRRLQNCPEKLDIISLPKRTTL